MIRHLLIISILIVSAILYREYVRRKKREKVSTAKIIDINAGMFDHAQIIEDLLESVHSYVQLDGIKNMISNFRERFAGNDSCEAIAKALEEDVKDKSTQLHLQDLWYAEDFIN